MDDNRRGAAPAASDLLSIDAALADMVYHRASEDQGLSLQEISDIFTFFDVKSQFNNINRTGSGDFIVGTDGFIYNKDTGFVCAILTDGTNFKIVYRGTDLATLSDRDAGDINADINLGLGSVSIANQARDALDVARFVIGLAGDKSKVSVVGQSLGGGLGGLVAAAFGLPATLIAPAPFEKSIASIAIIEALRQCNIVVDDIDNARSSPELSANLGGELGAPSYKKTVGDLVKQLPNGDDLYNKFIRKYNELYDNLYRKYQQKFR